MAARSELSGQVLTQIIYPQGYQFLYGYTQRNQLDNIKLDPAIFGGYYNTPLVQYVYDASGNHTRRTLISGAHAEYDIDELNRVRGQGDYFGNGQMGRFDYRFDPMGRHRYEQRDWGTADGYQFDPRDELTGYKRDGDLNMDGTVSAGFWNNTNVVYDNNGNRTQVTGVGAATYTHNNLNQYGNVSNLGELGYDPKGNLASATGWTYSYDAQNRLTMMQGPGMTITQTYDPLNRVVTRNVNGAVTQNVWEGWNLIEEHRADWSIQRCYLQGANQNEMVVAFDGGVYSNQWYWQDGRGNTSHITGDNAYLLERYTYDLSGAPKFYDEWGNERFGGSVYDTRFLFAGSQYLPETGLYDMRNRFYSPTLNRFLQTDPSGFGAGDMNLYRYCGDDPVDRSDPMGLADQTLADRIWNMACFFDGGNSFKGSLIDFLKRLLPAGMGTGAAGDKPISSENEGPKTGNSQDGSRPRHPSFIRREVTSNYVRLAKDENGNPLYVVHIGWKLTLLDKHGQPTFGADIPVHEDIKWGGSAFFKPSGKVNGDHVTKGNGLADDPWNLPFTSPKGELSTTQTITVGGQKARWDATVKAASPGNPAQVAAQQWAPFEEQ
jgi:RHS repeat-associated protein